MSESTQNIGIIVLGILGLGIIALGIVAVVYGRSLLAKARHDGVEVQIDAPKQQSTMPKK